jgi:hypothetical protein
LAELVENMFETKDVEEIEEHVSYSIEFFCTFCVLDITKQDRVEYRTITMLCLLHVPNYVLSSQQWSCRNSRRLAKCQIFFIIIYRSVLA